MTDFNKQIGRSDLEPIDLNKDEYYIHVGTEEEKLENPNRRSVPTFDFGKSKPRFDDQANRDLAEILQPDQLILDPEPLKPKIKGHVRFSEGPRFPEEAKNKDMYDKNDYPANTEMKIDANQGINATKKVGPSVGMAKSGMNTRKK